MEPAQLTVVVEDKQFAITPQMLAKMHYLQQWRALTPHHINLCEIKFISLSHWNLIVQILNQLQYKIPDTPIVRSTEPRDYIGTYLSDKFASMTVKELNELYLAVRYLKIQELRQAIATFFATKVYIGSKQEDLAQRIAYNNITAQLTPDLIEQYRQNYPFLNLE